MRKTAVVFSILVLLGAGVYLGSRAIVHWAYNSRDIVFEDKVVSSEVLEELGITPEPKVEDENEMPSDESEIIEEVIREDSYKKQMIFDETKYNMGYEDCVGIPESVYNNSNLEARVEEYLGDKYADYSPVLSHIEAVANSNISALNYEYTSDLNPDEYIGSGDYMYANWSLLQDSDILRFRKTSIYDNDSELQAIYFFGNYYVVYEVVIDNGSDSVFIVVDYSKTGFTKSDMSLQLGDMLGTVIVYKDNAVYEEYMGKHIIYAPMWDKVYYDRDGNLYHGQDLIDNIGNSINW